jgi:hypothetical protein
LGNIGEEGRDGNSQSANSRYPPHTMHMAKQEVTMLNRILASLKTFRSCDAFHISTSLGLAIFPQQF